MNGQSNHTGIEISPAYFETTINNSQESISYSIEITNYGENEATLQTSLGEFDQNPDTLMNYLISSNNYPENINPQKLVLEAGQTQKFKIDIEIPQECKSQKTCNLALVIKLLQPDQEKTTTSTFEQAIPLYITQSEAAEPIDSQQHNSDTEFQIKIEIPKIIISKESEIKVKLKNTGDTYATPDAYVQFYNLKLLSNKRALKTDTRPIYNRGIKILPEREITREIIYTNDKLEHIEIEAIVEEQNQVVETKSKSFWIVPPKFIIYAVILLVLIISAVIVSTKFKIFSKIFKKTKK